MKTKDKFPWEWKFLKKTADASVNRRPVGNIGHNYHISPEMSENSVREKSLYRHKRCGMPWKMGD